MSALPIDVVIPELLLALQQRHQVILKAPPGAGKSTRFPLRLLQSKAFKGKIIMLEPRRLAARNIAQYVAQQLGEAVGQTVGYRVRGETKVSAQTQLEVVTEGILTRMIQRDPELTGIDLLIFDEFHERSLPADTALAFALEVQMALREELKILIMSATLDHAALQGLLPDAHYIESQGRSYPVSLIYRPLLANQGWLVVLEQQIRQLLSEQSGSLLAFLPSAASISQLQQKLTDLPADIEVHALFGQMPFAQQQQALIPSPAGQRKVVLATNIAETSLTIEGVRLVVDSGLERRARFDLKTGITRLEEVRISQSSAQQRAGRAGRLEPGLCVRLYSEGQLRQQMPTPPADILHSDLAPLALELAQWGASSASDLLWLDLPPAPALKQAQTLLVELELLDARGQLTRAGKQAHQLGIEPRLAAMLVWSAAKGRAYLATAIALAVLIEEPERQVLDIQHSLYRWQQQQHSKLNQWQRRAKALAQYFDYSFAIQDVDDRLLASVAYFAFPDRLAQQRAQHGQYILANGHGAFVSDQHPLAGCEYLLAIDLIRSQQQASQIFAALAVDLQSLLVGHSSRVSARELVQWDEQGQGLLAERQQRLGQLVITRQPIAQPASEKITEALLDFVQRQGLSVLNWDSASQEWLARVRCASEWLPEEAWPDMSEQGLLNHLDLWLAPYLTGVRSAKALQRVSLLEALHAYLGWPLNQQLDQWLPTHHLLPTGSRKKIRYQVGYDPVLSVKMQEVFGEKSSPLIAKGRIPLVMELLSPAQRPLQITRDLASFWQGAYREVQKEMKGRYPKHIWPDDPANHIATTKTKRHFDS